MNGTMKILDHSDKDLWYRIKHIILPTLDVLHKMGKVCNQTCCFCDHAEESLEHLFIFCIKTWPAWIFIENIVRIYTGVRFFYVNDNNKVLGYGNQLTDVPMYLIAKLVNTIWRTRCMFLSEDVNKDDTRLITSYKNNLKHSLKLEKHRFSEYEFITVKEHVLFL